MDAVELAEAREQARRFISRAERGHFKPNFIMLPVDGKCPYCGREELRPGTLIFSCRYGWCTNKLI